MLKVQGTSTIAADSREHRPKGVGKITTRNTRELPARKPRVIAHHVFRCRPMRTRGILCLIRERRRNPKHAEQQYERDRCGSALVHVAQLYRQKGLVWIIQSSETRQKMMKFTRF